ncbi:MAG: HNH endonuclease [Chloroflexi bacterium]|nr:HNH endonuclease [Chloroflexota bacterium]
MQRYPSPRTQHSKLLADIGAFCQGCGADYTFDSRVLEVDHINPRSQDGTDAYENLTLLCPPCNKEKRDRYTLIGLQDHNQKMGYMKDKSKIWTRRASGARRGRRR